MKKSREEIIEELIATEFVEKYAYQLAKSNDADCIEDGIQDIWVVICSLPEKRLQELYYSDRRNHINGVRRYVAGVIYRTICSKTSAYYRTYKKPRERQYVMQEGMTLERLERCEKFDRHWYDGKRDEGEYGEI